MKATNSITSNIRGLRIHAVNQTWQYMTTPALDEQMWTCWGQLKSDYSQHAYGRLCDHIHAPKARDENPAQNAVVRHMPHVWPDLCRNALNAAMCVYGPNYSTYVTLLQLVNIVLCVVC